MTSTSPDNRSAPQRAQEPPPRRHEAGQRAPDAAAKSGTTARQPSLDPRQRPFAPGEDGECH